MEKIASIAVELVQYPLIRPYVLSFGTLHHFDSVQVRISLTDGGSRTAEVVPLPGYNHETVESVQALLAKIGPQLYGLSLQEARGLVVPHIAETPFSVSPLLTAIDLFGVELPAVDSEIQFVRPTATKEIGKMLADLELAVQNGQELKVKLSGDRSVDEAGLQALFDVPLKSPDPVRLDANQGFTLEDAIGFYGWIRERGFQKHLSYVEQPLNSDDWDGLIQLVKDFPEVPTMLDETVVTDADVERAIQNAFPFVKLKLFKQGGLKELIRQSVRFQAEGVKVVLGNGVATSLSNELENGVYTQYRTCFYGQSEGNGFLKIKTT